MKNYALTLAMHENFDWKKTRTCLDTTIICDYVSDFKHVENAKSENCVCKTVDKLNSLCCFHNGKSSELLC